MTVSSGTTPTGWDTATVSWPACRSIVRSVVQIGCGVRAPRPRMRSSRRARSGSTCRTSTTPAQNTSPHACARISRRRPSPRSHRGPSRRHRPRKRRRPRDTARDAPPPGIAFDLDLLREGRGCRCRLPTARDRARPTGCRSRASRARRRRMAVGQACASLQSSRACRPIVNGWSGTSVRSSALRSRAAWRELAMTDR